MSAFSCLLQLMGFACRCAWCFGLVTEEVTWTNDGNSGPEIIQWRREMLASLTASLDTILPFLHSALEASYGLAMEAGNAGNQAASQLHAATVSAALSASSCPYLKEESTAFGA